MKDLKIRCSSIHKIMGNGKRPDGLTETATTYIKQLVKEFVFEYTTDIDSKYLEKGKDCELEAIKLYNEYFFTNHEKNEGEKSNDWVKTESCDVKAKGKIIDFKCSWDANTFPATVSDMVKKCKKAGYEWQLRGYMWIYDKDSADLVDCLVDTPPELIGYVSDTSSHEVDHLPPELRMTILKFERDPSKEQLIIDKVKACRLFAAEYLKEILNKNN